MWDDCYGDVVGTGVSKNNLDIQESDLFRFIEVLVHENRHWDSNYYDTCHKQNLLRLKFPCSKALGMWRRLKKVPNYGGEKNTHSSSVKYNSAMQHVWRVTLIPFPEMDVCFIMFWNKYYVVFVSIIKSSNEQ